MGSVVDVVLLIVLAVYAVRGWRIGLLATLLELLGLLAGLIVALVFGPRLLAELNLTGPAATLALIGMIFVAMVLGEAIVGRVGHMMREANRVKVLRGADTLLGAVASVVIMALATWFAGAAVRPIAPAVAARAIDRSVILQTMDEVLPGQAARFAAGMTRVLDAAGFPTVFTGLTPEPDLPAAAPDAGVVDSPGVRAAASSVVRVHTAAPQCQRHAAGSGWVSDPERVVTNAHVVAGAAEVTVQARGQGRVYPATVVVFDPQLDLAVLEVPGLRSQPLAQVGELADGTSTAVAGFPQGGAYSVEPARVRGALTAAGEDIYGTAGVEREIYSLRTHVVPGNSGGPLLTADGRVAGTIFARSVTDTSTGYALTNAATRALIERAAADTTPASTGSCPG